MVMKGIFEIKNKQAFNVRALEIFYLQAEKYPLYKNYLEKIKIFPRKITDINNVPFLPIEFFKTELSGTSKCAQDNSALPIKSPGAKDPGQTKNQLFLSSGTTGSERSRHFVSDLSIYEKSYTKCFELFFGKIEEYCLIALLPSYLENKNSSLIYMVRDLIKKTKNRNSGFFQPLKSSGHEKQFHYEALLKKLKILQEEGQKTILMGVSYAFLDFADAIKKDALISEKIIFMETGGMKGKRKELVREELHHRLTKAFGLKNIHSEYGMTELLSQAYSYGKGIFNCPPWMKVLIRDTNDPFKILNEEMTGGINIIDLANINSCSFIATQDIGKLYSDGSFEVQGRFDNSDVRGCNLLSL